ncbi:CHY zinc finger-domain-containing protein [Flagelloscypha sp. PMI_526]|nr:CHY zinc finger-domain-containing protein [Flagelloscypha sp. PMI_526]
MCKHILNAQVSIRAPCCKQWFDCPQCHADSQSHPLRKTDEMTFICKKCKKAFRKDMVDYDESDEYCPHCDNHYVIEAKTPQAVLGVEGEDARIDSRMIKDERAKQKPQSSIFMRDDWDERLG